MSTGSLHGHEDLTVVEGYESYLAAVAARFRAATEGGSKLFVTNVGGLFATFLEALPSARRQHYTCKACQRFVERFGGLVTLSPDGVTRSAFWDPDGVPPFFANAVLAMARAVARGKVTGVFLSDETVWGKTSTPSAKRARPWHHMSVTPSAALVWKATVLLSTSQAAAEKREDYAILSRSLAEFSHDVVKEAHTLLSTGALYRSEKCVGGAKWLLDLHASLANAKGAGARENLTWLAVASAPAGFCHVRSSMIGTLLEDVAVGISFGEIKRRFDDKMDPLKYQRPTALPSEGNVAQAEAIVQKLASAGALARRFARLDDIQALWKPAPPASESKGGVFSHLKTRGAKPASSIEQPPVTMTWEKFARTALQGAEAIELFVPRGTAPYVGLVTAVHPEAPPILQWDSVERRNPVSWYFYAGGSEAANWNLRPDTFHPVSAVTLQPPMWGGSDKHAHQGQKVFFLLEGARDLRYQRGCGYFPEILRSEYHAVRKTMEAYAREAVVADAASASACGLGLQNGAAWNYLFRVTSKGTRLTYKLDRWD